MRNNGSERIKTTLLIMMLFAGIGLIAYACYLDHGREIRNVIRKVSEVCRKDEAVEIKEGNRGIVTIRVRENGRERVYQAALNESDNKIADIDRENGAAWFTYPDYVLIGDHNYQGLDILEDIVPGVTAGILTQADRDDTGSGNAVLTITPPDEDARDLNLLPGSGQMSAGDDTSGDGTNAGSVISPISGEVVSVDESGVSGEQDSGSQSVSGYLQGRGMSLPGQMHEQSFVPVLKFPGLRYDAYLTDVDNRQLEEYIEETGAEIATYTCRDNADDLVWIVLWKEK